MLSLTFLFIALCTKISVGAPTCNPWTAPALWNSTTGAYVSVLASGPDSLGVWGVLLLEQGPNNGLTRISLEDGTPQWYISNDILKSNRISSYATAFEYLVYYNTYDYGVVVRIDALTGKFYSNLTLEIESGSQVFTKFGCSNKLYSVGGGYEFMYLFANDVETGSYFWKTTDSVEPFLQISSDCRFIYYLSNPVNEVKNYTVVKIDATTGAKVWETDTGLIKVLNPGIFYLTLSDPAKRLALSWFDYEYHKEANLILFSTETGDVTFEIFLKATEAEYSETTPYFSPIGNFLVFAPSARAMGIQISHQQPKDLWIWSYDSDFGMLNGGPFYFSPSGKTVLIYAWNGAPSLQYVYSALDCASGKSVWDSPVLEARNGVWAYFDGPDSLCALMNMDSFQTPDFRLCPMP